MGRLEMYAAVRDLIILDDDKAGCEKVERQVIEREMGNGTLAFLGHGVGRLEDDDAFGKSE